MCKMREQITEHVLQDCSEHHELRQKYWLTYVMEPERNYDLVHHGNKPGGVVSKIQSQKEK